jgi:hypothetical protein
MRLRLIQVCEYVSASQHVCGDGDMSRFEAHPAMNPLVTFAASRGAALPDGLIHCPLHWLPPALLFFRNHLLDPLRLSLPLLLCWPSASERE